MPDGAATALVAALGRKYLVDAALTFITSFDLHELEECLDCVGTNERNVQLILGTCLARQALLLG